MRPPTRKSAAPMCELSSAPSMLTARRRKPSTVIVILHGPKISYIAARCWGTEADHGLCSAGVPHAVRRGFFGFAAATVLRQGLARRAFSPVLTRVQPVL